MAKGKLEYNLPEENVEFDMACKAGDLYIVLVNIDNELRSHLRHNSHPEWHSKTVEEIRKILNEMMTDYCLHFG